MHFFVLPFKLEPKPRPRAIVKKGKIFVYTPNEYKNWCEDVGDYIRPLIDANSMRQTNVYVGLFIGYQSHAVNPDIDNTLKSILDILVALKVLQNDSYKHVVGTKVLTYSLGFDLSFLMISPMNERLIVDQKMEAIYKLAEQGLLHVEP